MRTSTIAMSTIGAVAGFAAGNYLYSLDVEANKYREVPIPFYTVRKVAKDVSEAAEKTYNNIKSKLSKATENDKVEEMTDEQVAEMLQNDNVVQIADYKDQPDPADNEAVTTTGEVIETEVVDGKAIPINQQEETTQESPVENQESATSEAPAAPEQKVVGNTDDTEIPKFTVVDNQAITEAPKQEAPVAPEQKSATTKATVKGSKAKAGK